MSKQNASQNNAGTCLRCGKPLTAEDASPYTAACAECRAGILWHI